MFIMQYVCHQCHPASSCQCHHASATLQAAINASCQQQTAATHVGAVDGG